MLSTVSVAIDLLYILLYLATHFEATVRCIFPSSLVLTNLAHAGAPSWRRARPAQTLPSTRALRLEAPFSSAAKTSDARSANGCAHRRLKLQCAALHQRALNPFLRHLDAPFESRSVSDTAAAVAETRHCLCAVSTASAPLGAVSRDPRNLTLSHQPHWIASGAACRRPGRCRHLPSPSPPPLPAPLTLEPVQPRCVLYCTGFSHLS